MEILKNLKGKINYKKLPAQKQFNNKYEFKKSQTISTNQSKINHSQEKSTLINLNAVPLHSIIEKNLKKYGNSNDLFYLSDFEQTFAQARTRQKILLKDLCSFAEQEHFQKFYKDSKSLSEIEQLVEYYKYYINNPILFAKQHFKNLYNFYEKKKYLQYKRLKTVLDLEDNYHGSSQNSMNQNITLYAKKSTKETTKTFYIMNLVHTDLSANNNQSESKAFLQLNSNLQQILGKKQIPPFDTNQNQDYFESIMGSFKRKKVETPNFSSIKNTIAKKSKKESFNNSNSSLKKMRFTKPSKELNPFKFVMQSIQFSNMNKKPQLDTRNKRRNSNLSMGQLQEKNNLNIFCQKKIPKKRLNSCETVISRNGSQQKAMLERRKKLLKSDLKSKFQEKEGIQLTQFEEYMKKMESNARKKHHQLRIIDKNRGKITPLNNQKRLLQVQTPKKVVKKRGQGSQQRFDNEIRIKKMKKKRTQNNNSSSKNSIGRSPSGSSKQHLIDQNISNLKKKIRLAKQSIKNNSLGSNSNLQTHKKQKTQFISNK